MSSQIIAKMLIFFSTLDHHPHPLLVLVGSSSSSITDDIICDKCKNFPIIRPSGVFFLDGKVQNVTSADGVSPKFQIGSYFGDKVRYHMADDMVHFSLFEEYVETKKRGGGGGGLAFDMGANQGFFTYYLAALGMNVHSFEIANRNFVALMHGRHFNTKSIADRVNLYPMGLDNKVSRFSLNGANYGGFLKENEDGPILGTLWKDHLILLCNINPSMYNKNMLTHVLFYRCHI